MNRLEDLFSDGNGKIAFLTAGDPTLDSTKDYILALEAKGVDLIELGIPFSDPIAELSVIQEANIRALENRVTTDDIFLMIKELRDSTNINICLKTYLNVVFHYGYDNFFKKCKEIQVQGIIIPDLPYEESLEVKAISDKYGIEIITTVTYTSINRIEKLVKDARGFIIVDNNVDNRIIDEIRKYSKLAIISNNKDLKVDGFINDEVLVTSLNKQGIKAIDLLY